MCSRYNNINIKYHVKCPSGGHKSDTFLLMVPEFQSSSEVATYLDVFKCNLYKAFSSCAMCKDNELRFT